MGMRAIAAGDSLQVEADVPLPLGPVEDLVFDAMAERHDRRLRCAGVIAAIDPAARTVSVYWPMGQLTAGRWRIQLRAATPALVSTFILDDEVPVEPSLLPIRTGLLRARLAVLRVRFAADGHGAAPVASLHLITPRIGLSAGGTGGLAGKVARFVTPRVRMAALGASASRGQAMFLVVRPGMRADGPGGRVRAAAVLSALRPSMRVSGPGHTVQAAAALRLPGVRMTAAGVGDVAAGVLTLSVPRPRMAVSVINMLSPAAPSAPGYSVLPGPNPGQVTTTIDMAPPVLGDGEVVGDQQGEITAYRIRIGAPPAAEYSPSSLPLVVIVGGFDAGEHVPFEIQALGYDGRPGALVTGTVEIPVVSEVSPYTGLVDGLTGYGLMAQGVGLAIRVSVERPPAAPSAPGYSMLPGPEADEVTAIIDMAPQVLGDGAVAGDRAGSVTGYQISINGAAAVDYDPTPLPISVTVGGFVAGQLVPYTLRALGFEGRPGAPINETLEIPTPSSPPYFGLVDPATGYGILSQGVGWAMPNSLLPDPDP